MESVEEIITRLMTRVGKLEVELASIKRWGEEGWGRWRLVNDAVVEGDRKFKPKQTFP